MRGESAISTYINLINYTLEGIAAIKDSPKRLNSGPTWRNGC